MPVALQAAEALTMSAERQPEASDWCPVPGILVAGRYRLSSELGRGGMGEVFLAHNINLPDLRVAIKFIQSEFSHSPERAQMLREEAQRQVRLESEHIVKVHDLLEWHGKVCLVMEYVPGQSLARVIEQHPKGLPLPKALSTIKGLLRGLNAAHEQGVLHSDIKPDNVLLDATGDRVRLMDFGVSRDLGSLQGGFGARGGTPAYMSPEQLRQPDHVDHRSDVYSAGVVFFELLTGQLPFDLTTDSQDFPQFTQALPRLRSFRPELPSSLERIVSTALQSEPSQRFQGCKQFLQAIDEFERGEARRARRLRVGIASLAGLSLVALVGYVWYGQVQTDTRARQAEADAQRAAALRQQSEAIEQGVRTALVAASTMCREYERMLTKAKALKTSKEAGFPDLVIQLQRQVDELKANIALIAKQHSDALDQLRRADAAVVGSAIERYGTSESAAAHNRDELKRELRSLSQGQSPLDLNARLAKCERTAGGLY